MRIVYNLRDQDWQTTKSLGILHVSTRVLLGLAELPGFDRIDVLANRSLEAALGGLPETPGIRVHFGAAPAPRGWGRLLWDHWSVVRSCDRLRPDWLLLPKGFSPLLRWPRCRVSAFVHDDLFGHYRRQGLRPFPAGQAMLFHRMLRQTAARADAIVTNSAFTATEFQRGFQPRRPPVRIGAPVAAAAGPPPLGAAPSLLLPTSAWPHKLTRQAIDWVQRWTEATGFAGQVLGFGSLPRDVRWPAGDRWRHHGRLADSELAAWATTAATLIYFSEYEGYGLPPVEAAAAGRRTVASDLPPLRETLPPSVLFSNRDYASFERTLTRVVGSPPAPPRCVETARDVAGRWRDVLRPPPGQET